MQKWKSLSQNNTIKLQHLQSGLDLLKDLSFTQHQYNGEPVFKLGSMELIEYASQGRPILVIPSLINRAYILDISSTQSFVLRLQELGFRPYLINWNDSKEEFNLDIAAYLEQRILPAIEFINKRTSNKPLVAGYCMGGLFAVASATLYHDLLAGCITVATPWNFHAPEFLKYPITKNIAAMMVNIIKKFSYIPKEMFDYLFYGLNSIDMHEKYIEYGKSSEKFVQNQLVEKWVNDSVDMSAPVLVNCMQDFIINNVTYHDRWLLKQQYIMPSNMSIPNFCAIALQDKVAPITATLPLAVRLNNAHVELVDTGHLGMIISTKNNITAKIAKWAVTL